MIDVIDSCLCVLFILRWGYSHIMWKSRKLHMFCKSVINFSRRCFLKVEVIAYSINWSLSVELELRVDPMCYDNY